MPIKCCRGGGGGGDGIHYAITSYAIELRPPPYLFETQGLGLRLGARARAKARG